MRELLSAQVTTLPETEKDASIHCYVELQRHNASAYAAEGKLFQATWNEDPQMGSLATPVKLSEEFESGFQTPVLKPRPLRAFPARKEVEEEEEEPPTTTTLVYSHAKTTKFSTIPVANAKLANRRKAETTELTPENVEKPKKRRGGESLDEEHEDRKVILIYFSVFSLKALQG